MLWYVVVIGVILYLLEPMPVQRELECNVGEGSEFLWQNLFALRWFSIHLLMEIIQQAFLEHPLYFRYLLDSGKTVMTITVVIFDLWFL